MKFQEPNMQIVRFTIRDVIATSGKEEKNTIYGTIHTNQTASGENTESGSYNGSGNLFN